MRRVAIIIVNYKGRDDTRECLGSLSRLTYLNYCVYLVDQASGDGTPDAVRSAFPEVQVIENPANNGFTGGNNDAIRRALSEGADYVFLLNNDTIVAPDLLERLVEGCEADPTIGAVGPLMLSYHQPETVWSSGGCLGSRGESRMRDQGRDSAEIPEELTEPDFIVGCGLLAPRRVWEGVGFLDERYFLYYEDADWCARVRASGRRLATVPSARLWHKVGRSLGTAPDRTLYYMRRNVFLFLEQNVPQKRALWAARREALRLIAVLWVRGKWKQGRIVWRAFADYHRRRFGAADFKP